MKLVKGSIPLYAQIENKLRSRIISGKLSTMTAKEICKEFGVSSITAYHALGTLANEGLIRLEAGKKTIVLSERENISAKVIGSIDDIIIYARETTYNLLRMRTIKSDEKLSKLLNINIRIQISKFHCNKTFGKYPFWFC